MLRIDAQPPVTTPPAVSPGYMRPEPLALDATDPLSGVAATYYSVGANPGPPTTVYDPANKPVLKDGERIRYYSVDRAGNVEAERTSVPAKLDSTPPVTTLTGLSDGLMRPQATMTLTATDAQAGVAAIRYSVGANPGTPSTIYNPANKPVLQDGQRIRYYAVDAAGNAEAEHVSAVAKVDGDAPHTLLYGFSTAWSKAPFAVTLIANDLGPGSSVSGVAATYYSVGASPGTPTTLYDPAHPPVLHDRERISYYSVDGVGNVETVLTSDPARIDGARRSRPRPASRPGTRPARRR